nr:hypothetical protein [Tanacetum cinerariifolium]
MHLALGGLYHFAWKDYTIFLGRIIPLYQGGLYRFPGRIIPLYFRGLYHFTWEDYITLLRRIILLLLGDLYHFSWAIYTSLLVRVLSSPGVAPYNDATLEDLKTKHLFKPSPSLPHIFIDHHHLVASLAVVLDRIKSFPRGTSCGRDGLRAQHLMDCLSVATVAISDELVSSITQVVNLFLDGKCPNMLGEYIASAPLTPLIKPGGGIRPIDVGTVWRRLIFKVSVVMIGNSLNGYLDDLQFGVGVSGGGEAILHTVNRLIEDRGDDVGLSMLLVDFKNAFNFVDRESRMELYIENRENGRIILKLVLNGPLVWPTIVEENGTTRTKKYEELSVAEKADCDLKPTNIVLQGLPPDMYAIVNHHKVVKEIWDRVKLLMQGTKLSLQEKECLVVYVFTQGDDPSAYLNRAMAFLSDVAASRFPSTNNQLRTSSNPRNQALFKTSRLLCNKFKGGKDKVMLPKRPRNAAWLRDKAMLSQAQESGQILDEEQLAFLVDLGILEVVLIANLSNYGSDVISKVPLFKPYHNDMDNQSVHAMQDFKQTAVVNFLNNDIISDSNIILYSQYLQKTQQAVVQDTNLYAQQDSMILSVIEQMSKQMINHVNMGKVIKKGKKILTKPVGSSEQTYEPTTAEEKQDIRNEMKARGTLLMALPNKDQLKFHSYQDAKLLMEAIEKRYGGNKESKKVQRTLLKQQYENFATSSSETLDQTFDRLQKLISQLELQGEVIQQEDINLKLLRSLPSKWKTHALIWRNKAELETISLDDLYNNLKIYEPKILGSSNTNQNPQNMAFASLKSTSSTNEADTTASGVSTAHTQGSNLDMNGRIIGFDKTKVECFNYHKNGHFAREYRALRDQDNRGREYGRTTVPVETPIDNALIAQDGIGGQVSDKSKVGLGYKELILKIFVISSELLEKQNNRSTKGYHEVSPPLTGNYMPLKRDLRLIDEHFEKDWHSDDDSEDELSPTVEVKTVKPSVEKIEYVKTPRETVKTAESHKPHKHYPRGNKRNWNNLMSHRLGSNFKMINKACYVCGSFEHIQYVCDKKDVRPIRNNSNRVKHKKIANKFTHPHPKRGFVPQAVLTRSAKINTAAASVNTAVRPVNVAGSQSTVNHSRPISKVIPRRYSQQTRPFNKLSSNKRSVFNKKVNNVRVNDSTARERAVVSGNMGRDVNAVKATTCWVWKAKNSSASTTFKKYSYIDGNPQHKEYKEKGVIDSGCSRNMTGNKCYLTDFEAFDGGFVSFGDRKVTYTSVPSSVEDYLDIGSPEVKAPLSPDYAPLSPDYVPGLEEPEQAPLSPDYIPGPEEPKQAPPSPVYLPYVPEPVYPEYMPTEDDVFPVEEQPLPVAATPTADSPGYIPEFDPNRDPEEDEEEDPGEDPADYPADFTVVALPAVDHVLSEEKRLRFASPTHSQEVRESSAADAARQNEPTIAMDNPYSLVREELYGFVDRVDVAPGRLMSKELGYGNTDTRDELVRASEEIAPTTLQGVNQRVTNLSFVVEHESTIMYGMMEEAQDDREREREARMAREAWGISMDASDNARSNVMSLRTTLVAQHAMILDLQETDRRRQGVIKELLAADHKRQVQLTKALRLLKRLQTQMIEFQRHHGPVKGPTQPDAPGEADSSS